MQPQLEVRGVPFHRFKKVGGDLHRSSLSLTLGNPDGHDNSVNVFLEHVYSDLNREGLLDFGPRVHEGPVRRRSASRQNFSGRDAKRRNVEATLIANLNSHTDAVNGVAVSSDHLFFVSCSDDKTVKVWDTARLERNVTSKPRHTYVQHHSRVRCVCMLEGYHAFASAAEDGSLHVIRVDVNQSGSLPKYNKLHVVREYRIDKPGEFIQCMTHYNSGKCSCLLSAIVLKLCFRIIIELDLRHKPFLNCPLRPE